MCAQRIPTPPPSDQAREAMARAEKIMTVITAAKGGKRRDGQVTMAMMVAGAMTDAVPLLVQGGTGVGKALAVDTPIPTPRGFTPMGSLTEGSIVLDEAGKPCNVTIAHPVQHDRDCYRLEVVGGGEIVADGEHLWPVCRPHRSRSGEAPWGDYEVLDTATLADRIGKGERYAIPAAAPLQLPDTELPLDPYLLGLYIAGTNKAGVVRVPRPFFGDEPIVGLEDDHETRTSRYRYLAPTTETQQSLNRLGVGPGNRSIPTEYLFSGVEQRRALLSGLVDAGAATARSTIKFSDISEAVAQDVRTLASTLGHRASIAPRYHSGKIVTWTTSFTPATQVFRSRKAERIEETSTGRRVMARAIVSVEKVPSVPVRCITVDSDNSLFLAGQDMIPTHNSLAYLAGAVAARKKVVVAPHTIALQRQLMDDLDLLKTANEELLAADLIPHEITTADLQGRSNYVCREKVTEPTGTQASGVQEEIFTAEQAEPASELGSEVRSITKWVSEDTETGNRSDLPFPSSRKAWGLVSVTSEDCAGKACPFHQDGSCFAEVAKAKAAEAQIIVTNQAMLAMAMQIPMLLPEGVDALVVDESHEFTGVLAESFGAKVNPARLLNAAKKAATALSPHDDNAPKVAEDIEKDVKRLENDLPRPKGQDRDMINHSQVQSILRDIMGGVARFAEMSKGMGSADDEQKAKKQILQQMLGNLVADIDRVLAGSTDHQVAWVEQKTGQVTFRAARFDVGDLIHEHLIEPYGSLVFTSATLTMADSFDLPAKSLGVRDEDDNDRVPWLGRMVQSPFDYPNQGMLWFPDGIPAPSTKQDANRAYLEAVADVVVRTAQAAGGRTLVLCTSRAAVVAISECVEQAVGDKYPVLAQQPGEPAGPLAKRFAEEPHTILIGTRTFWTGVSTEGPTCSAVVIDKLPFPSPADPIVAARSEKADRRRKGSSFTEVSLFEACLTVVQGAGRLIRTVTDTGLVVICDPRLNPQSGLKKFYSTQILRSLPPFSVASGEQEALGQLLRIDAAADDSQNDVQIEVGAASAELVTVAPAGKG